jgi:glycine amidinotransferase
METGAHSPVVSSFNDWDPLEEVIVGVLDGCVTPALEIGHLATMYREALAGDSEALLRSMLEVAGKPRRLQPGFAAARACLDELVEILEGEGVVVRRPEARDHARGFSTPDWTAIAGSGQTVPRDVMVVIGDEILESTMSFRNRYWEINAYRPLIKEYFRRGARWTAPPKPELADELYDFDYRRGREYVLTEFEPVFDVADIVRLGRDLLVQRSHVTNDLGIEWLRRHFEPTYRVHAVEFDDYRAHHVDATFVPLAEGKVLVSPDRPIRELPAIFRRSGWELLSCPPTTMPRPWPSTGPIASGIWIHMNVLSLDDRRVIVDAEEEPLIRALRGWGFQPIPCRFRDFYPFGGGFHCATCDVRRRGRLRSYF